MGVALWNHPGELLPGYTIYQAISCSLEWRLCRRQQFAKMMEACRALLPSFLAARKEGRLQARVPALLPTFGSFGHLSVGPHLLFAPMSCPAKVW